MDAVIAALPVILGSSTFTGGTLMALTFLLLQRGVIHTNGELVRTIAASEAAHKIALDAKDEIIAEIRANAGQGLADRDIYRQASELHADRANKLQSKMIEEVLPLVLSLIHI